MKSEPLLTPREKYTLQQKFSPDEVRTHGAASSRTESPTNYQLSYSDPHIVSTRAGHDALKPSKPSWAARPYLKARPALAGRINRRVASIFLLSLEAQDGNGSSSSLKGTRRQGKLGPERSGDKEREEGGGKREGEGEIEGER